jgi:hypothetical protein
MTIPEDGLREVYDSWRSYVAWQEKQFAGYLTVLAALGYALVQNAATPHTRQGILVAGIVLSIVFRIIDWRTAELVNGCQTCGQLLRGDASIYAHINGLRYAKGRCFLFRYSLAVDILAASVIGGSLFLLINPLTGALAFCFLLVLFSWLNNMSRKRQNRYLEQERKRASLSI